MSEPFERLPVRPPLLPMLAKLEETVPRGDGWSYEPKWDGFRGLIFRDGDAVRIGSRNTRPLERFFPELVTLFRNHLPDRCIVDGEIVIRGADGLDFGALQLRLHPAPSRIKLLSGQTPATFVAFDVVAIGDEDLRAVPFVRRRERLEALLKERPSPGLGLTPSTRDPVLAEKWVRGEDNEGLDGVVAKKDDIPYAPGERVMVKVKPRRTADCVVGGYRVHKDGKGVGSLLLGLYDDDGTLVHVGHAGGFTAKMRRETLEKLQPHVGGTSFTGEYAPGGPSRWSQGKDMTWHSVAPVFVCEVSFDRLVHHSFRHATTFQRWREDKDPKQCTFDQFG